MTNQISSFDPALMTPTTTTAKTTAASRRTNAPDYSITLRRPQSEKMNNVVEGSDASGGANSAFYEHTSNVPQYISESLSYKSRISGCRHPLYKTSGVGDHSHLYRNHHNTTFSLVQRSGALLIWEVISSLKIKTDSTKKIKMGSADADTAEEAGERRGGGGTDEDGDGESYSPLSASSPSLLLYYGEKGGLSVKNKIRSAYLPESEFTTLASCARDPYYRVIIVSSGGVVAIIRAMDAFRYNEMLQASGCDALASLCKNSRGNQIAAREGRGLGAVLNAMRAHPPSVAVQSSSCVALLHLTSRNTDSVSYLSSTEDFRELMDHALEQFMPPSSRESANIVLERVASTTRAEDHHPPPSLPTPC